MNILLLSAYDAASHKRWREGLVAHCSEHQWTCLHLPARYFNWRIRGNGLSWALGEPEVLAQSFDLIVATSMVDLATLKGLLPALSTVPSIVYFHENQFSYPLTAHQNFSLEPKMVNLYSALAADTLVFNSDYNRQTFLQGVSALLAKMPDAIPAGVVQDLTDKSQVLPVPIDITEEGLSPRANTTSNQELQLLWNHRWEYDKGPDKLLGCLQALDPSLKLRCHIVGQQFRREPEAFKRIYALLEQRGWLGQWGFIADVAEYQQLLRDSHIVLSTALHDFQGLSVLEAVAAGCVPVVPDRLAYKELFSDHYRYYSHFQNQHAHTHGAEQIESQACAASITDYAQRLAAGNALPSVPNIMWLSWQMLEQGYKQLLHSTRLSCDKC